MRIYHTTKIGNFRVVHSLTPGRSGKNSGGSSAWTIIFLFPFYLIWWILKLYWWLFKQIGRFFAWAYRSIFHKNQPEP